MVTKPRKHLHDTCGGTLGLDFVNSLGRPAAGPGKETLETYDDLLLWSEQAGSVPPRDARRLRRRARGAEHEAGAALVRARALREAIFRTLSALVHDTRPHKADLATINQEVAAALGHARLEHAPGGFRWSWQRSDTLTAPIWPIARSVADLLVSKDLARVKECASDECLWLFLDKTKNGARRWCEMKSCGNRAKVREHRRRKRSAPPPP